jgi:lipopolysaccharide transport system ATP-binding protein
LNIDRLDLTPGAYFVNVGVFDSDWSHAYDFHWHVYQLHVEGGSAHKGILAPPCRWAMDRGEREPDVNGKFLVGATDGAD